MLLEKLKNYNICGIIQRNNMFEPYSKMLLIFILFDFKVSKYAYSPIYILYMLLQIVKIHL